MKCASDRQNDSAAQRRDGVLADLEREEVILNAAESILLKRVQRLGSLATPTETIRFLRMRLGHLQHEEFHAVWLDTRHRILCVDRLFMGSIDGAAVYPREVLRRALDKNAAAVIFAHNHPSGVVDPSQSDRAITTTLKDGLQHIGVRVLDHIVIGPNDATSMAQMGLL